MSVNCELAKMIFIKFGYLEKRVNYLEEKSAEQVDIIDKLQKKLENVNIESPKKDENSYGNTAETEVEKDLNVIEMSSHSQSHQNSKIPGKTRNFEEILSRNLVVKVEELDVEKYIEKPMIKIKTENFENGNIQQKLTFTPISSWFQTAQNDTQEIDLPYETGPTPAEILAEENDPTFNPSSCGKRKKIRGKRQKILSKFGSKYTKKMSQKSVNCPICSKVFQRSFNLSQHMKCYHNKSYKCQVCQKLFGTRQNLDRHLLTHNIGIGKPRQSKGQGKRDKNIKRSKDIKIEEIIEAEKSTTTDTKTKTKVKPYKCQTCGKFYTEAHSLKIHQRIHTGDQTVKCQICSKLFTLQRNLEIHQRVHTGEQPFSCEVCGKKFSQKNNLDTHTKRVHSVGKPYGCSICMKKFADQKNLENHILLHST